MRLSGVVSRPSALIMGPYLTDAMDVLAERFGQAAVADQKQRAQAAGLAEGQAAAREGRAPQEPGNPLSYGAGTYTAYARIGYAAHLSNTAQQRVRAAAAAAPADPEAFDKAIAEVPGSFQGVPEEYRPALQQEIADRAAEARIGIEGLRNKRTQETAEGETRTALAARETEALKAARRGDADGLAKATVEATALARGLVATGGMSAQEYAGWQAHFVRGSQIESVLGGFDRARPQGIAAIRRYAESVRGDDALPLVPADRDELYGVMMREADGLQSAADRADREQEQELNKQRRALAEEARAAVASLNDGQPFAGLPDLVKRADVIDPDLGMALRRADADRGWLATLATMPPADQAAEIERTRKLQASTTDAPLAAGYGDRAAKAEQVLGRTVQALDKDPLGWAEARHVVDPTPIVAGDVESFRKRGAAAAAASAHYGVAVPVLRESEAAGVVDQFNRSTDPDEKLGLLSAYVLGFPDAAQQRQAIDVLTQAHLPASAALVLEKARDPMQRHVARRLMSELTIKSDRISLPDRDLQTAKKTATDTYDTGLGEVRLGAMAVTGNAAWRDQMETERRAVEQVTTVRLGTDDPSGSAYRDLFGDRQTIADDGFAFVAFPGSKRDLDRIESGLRALRADGAAKVMAVAPAEGMERRRMEELANDTAAAGTWVNWGDDRTFALIMPGTEKPVPLPNGDPWVVTLEQVQQVATHAVPANPLGSGEAMP